MPHRRYIYVADTLNVPYGDKPIEIVRELAIALTSFLVSLGCESVIMASGTSTVAGLEQAVYQFTETKIYGMIEPGARAAVEASDGPIAVFATNATARSKYFTDAIDSISPGRFIVEIGCPKFVPIVESGEHRTSAAYDAAREYVGKLSGAQFGALILGCTHFPFVSEAIRQALEDSKLELGRIPLLVDPAKELVRSIIANERHRDDKNNPACDAPTEFFSTSNPGAFAQQLENLLTMKDVHVREITLPVPNYSS